MGTSLRRIIFDIGAGVRNGGKFKAVLVGGPMGGFVPENMLDLRVDFDEMKKAVGTMGPSLIVLDESACMVDMSKYFLTFLSNESCGKCTPCREGIKQMIKILDRVTEGKGRNDDIEILELISSAQRQAGFSFFYRSRMLTVHNLSKSYGIEAVLQGIAFSLSPRRTDWPDRSKRMWQDYLAAHPGQDRPTRTQAPCNMTLLPCKSATCRRGSSFPLKKQSGLSSTARKASWPFSPYASNSWRPNLLYLRSNQTPKESTIPLWCACRSFLTRLERVHPSWRPWVWAHYPSPRRLRS